MLSIEDLTISQVFAAAVARYGDNAFLCLPSDAGRAYHPGGYSVTYREAATKVAAYQDGLRAAGYGHGHRIACLLANRPEIMLFKLAANALGISWVPVNPDYRPAELAYLLQDSATDLMLTGHEFSDLAAAGIAESNRAIPLIVFDETIVAFPPASRPAPLTGAITPDTEASLLHTSGTTGRPKGCILSNAYELEVGHWYAEIGGRMTLEEGGERVYNPLPGEFRSEVQHRGQIWYLSDA
ncbi:MAG: AMP-binding protein, partial [Alphaproteobacteria bacterium]